MRASSEERAAAARRESVLPFGAGSDSVSVFGAAGSRPSVMVGGCGSAIVW